MRPTSSGIKPYVCRSVGSTRSRGLYSVRAGWSGDWGAKNGRCFSKSLLSSDPVFTEIMLSRPPDDREDDEEEERMGEPNPIEPLATRFMTILCRPVKAPAKMKRILSVRTLYVSAFNGPEELLPEPEEVEEGPPITPPESGLLVG